MTAEDAMHYYEAVIEAEKKMGTLSKDERLVVLSQFGKNITHEELVEMLQTKRALIVKTKETPNDETIG